VEEASLNERSDDEEVVESPQIVINPSDQESPKSPKRQDS